jgi:hypothetical protein
MPEFLDHKKSALSSMPRKIKIADLQTLVLFVALDCAINQFPSPEVIDASLDAYHGTFLNQSSLLQSEELFLLFEQ